MERVPDSPDGMCSAIELRLCWPSWRLIVIVNGEKPPAWMLVTPAVSSGENGSEGPGQALPLGPEVISNVEEGVAG